MYCCDFSCEFSLILRTSIGLIDTLKIGRAGGQSVIFWLYVRFSKAPIFETIKQHGSNPEPKVKNVVTQSNVTKQHIKLNII